MTKLAPPAARASAAKSSTVAPLMSAAGVVAAGVLAVLINVLAARHYRRWDFTTHRLYTLSPATLDTLRSLPDPVRVEVLLPSSDPMASSVRLLLAEYQGKTRKLDVVFTDPDRHPAEFLALQQKYGIEAGKTDDGQVVMDASIIVSRQGHKPFFLSTAELVDVDGTEEFRTRSRMEQAFTLALRAVQIDERPVICFVTGHGEVRVDESGARGLSEFVSRLRKNNYDVDSVDTSSPNATNALDKCRVAVVVEPSQPFALADAERIRNWFQAGGNVFVLAGPVPDAHKNAFLPLGLQAITAAGGILMNEDFVFEVDPSRKLPGGLGDQFFAEPKPHEVTMGLLGPHGATDLKILVGRARSLSRSEDAKVAPAELLVAGKDAFGMTDFFAWVQKGGPPVRGPRDQGAPIVLAMASELARAADASAGASGGVGRPAKGQHGPRMIVVGGASPALGQNWLEPVLRGGAIFTESALTWLAARPPLVDLPEKPAVAGTRISEANLGEVGRYVLLYMPAAAALLGLAVYLRRRSTEGVTSTPSGGSTGSNE